MREPGAESNNAWSNTLPPQSISAPINKTPLTMTIRKPDPIKEKREMSESRIACLKNGLLSDDAFLPH